MMNLLTSFHHIFNHNFEAFSYLVALIWIDILVVLILFDLWFFLGLFALVSYLGIASTTLITYSIYLIIRSAIRFYSLIKNPSLHLSSHNIKTKKTEVLSEILERVSLQERVKLPKVIITNYPIIGSFGLNADEAVIFVGSEILDKLDASELEAVIIHETFHIKNDLRDTSENLAFTDTLRRPLNIIAISLIGIVLGVLPITTLPYLPKEHFIPFEIVGFLTFLPLITISLARNVVKHRMGFLGGIASGKSTYYREIMADVYVIYNYNLSQQLQRALISVARFKLDSELRSHFLPLIKYNARVYSSSADLESSHKFNSTLSLLVREILRIRYSTEDVEDIGVARRLHQIKFAIALLEGRIIVDIENETAFRARKRTLATMPYFIAKIVYQNRSLFPELYQKIRNCPQIDLTRLANSLNVSKFEMFILLFFLSVTRAVTFREITG